MGQKNLNVLEKEKLNNSTKNKRKENIAMVLLIVLCFLSITVGVIAIGGTYNKLVKLRNKVKNSWANIDAQLQRRFDLIPNLVRTVEAFAEHERQIIENVTAIRNVFLDAISHYDKLKANKELSSHLSALYAMTANYPQLKTDTNFLNLQEALAEVEEDITYARQFYNDAVTIYNNKLMSFPANIIASAFGFSEESLFDAVQDAEVAPKIHFKRHSKYPNCPNCGAAVPEDTVNCKYCGTSLI